NHTQVPRLVRLVKTFLPAGGTVGVLGLSYKPDTNVIEKSQGVELAQALLAEDVAVVVYDPCAMEAAKPALLGPVRDAPRAAECARQADVLVLTTPSKEFKALGPQQVAREGGQITVIDCWRLLSGAEFGKVCNYVALGTCDVLQAAQAREVGAAAA